MTPIDATQCVAFAVRNADGTVNVHIIRGPTGSLSVLNVPVREKQQNKEERP